MPRLRLSMAINSISLPICFLVSYQGPLVLLFCLYSKLAYLSMYCCKTMGILVTIP
ncbi:hypothetical protein V6Z12_D08G062500 [Gossypium hirsutum]